MEDSNQRIVLTGFMGVGKSTVARHLSFILNCGKVDLDTVIEESEQRTLDEIMRTDGEARFRQIETENLRKILCAGDVRIVALGGGAWTTRENRELIKQHRFITIWLESSFEHCWLNIVNSKRTRPLAKNKNLTRSLFDERVKLYCLADWHFIVKPDLTSFDIAKKIADEVFSNKI